MSEEEVEGLGLGLGALFEEEEGDSPIDALEKQIQAEIAQEETEKPLVSAVEDSEEQAVDFSALMDEPLMGEGVDEDDPDERAKIIEEIEGIVTQMDDDMIFEAPAPQEKADVAEDDFEISMVEDNEDNFIIGDLDEDEQDIEAPAPQEDAVAVDEDFEISVVEDSEVVEPIDVVPVNGVDNTSEAAAAPPKKPRSRQSVPIEKLYPSKFQPRRIFSDDSIEELSKSVAQYGVLQPLLVREDPENPDHYEIIAGERRWRASQKAQIHELPVVVLEIEELEAFKIALIENLQREDLDPIDEAWGYKKLLEEYNQTQEQLALAVGKSRPHITNMMRLLGLPDTVQAHLGAGDISMGHARALINAENPQDLATQVVKKGLSVRQTESLVKREKNAGKDQNSVQTKKVAGTNRNDNHAKSADTIALENDISNALGMNVTVDSNDGTSGTLSVEFKSLDQLDELLHRLAHYPGTRLNA